MGQYMRFGRVFGDWYLGVWLLLVGSVFAGVNSYTGFIGLSFESLTAIDTDPDQRLGVNYYVYHYAADALLAGEDFYDAPPPDFTDFFTFLYPPITVLFWVPGTLVDPFHGYLIHTAGTIVVCLVASVMIGRYLRNFEIELGLVDYLVIWAFFVAGTHSTGTINFGNINLWLAAGIVAGFVTLTRGRSWLAGGLFGLIALLKVFPAIVGTYLLAQRNWRAITGAVVTGGGGLIASALVFDIATVRRFFFDVLLPRSETEAFVGGYDPADTYYVTIQRPISHLLWEGELPQIALYPSAPEEALPILAAVVLGVPLAYSYIGMSTRIDKLVAVHTTLTVTIILLPSLRWYLALIYFSWVALLFVWGGPPGSIPDWMIGLAVGGTLFAAGLWITGIGPTAHWLPLTVLIGIGIGLAYGWYQTGFGTLFFLGGGVAAIARGPDTAIAIAETAPTPYDTVLVPLVSIASLQLIGLLMMFSACLWYKLASGIRIKAVRDAITNVPTAIGKDLQQVQKQFHEVRSRR